MVLGFDEFGESRRFELVEILNFKGFGVPFDFFSEFSFFGSGPNGEVSRRIVSVRGPA